MLPGCAATVSGAVCPSMLTTVRASTVPAGAAIVMPLGGPETVAELLEAMAPGDAVSDTADVLPATVIATAPVVAARLIAAAGPAIVAPTVTCPAGAAVVSDGTAPARTMPADTVPAGAESDVAATGPATLEPIDTDPAGADAVIPATAPATVALLASDPAGAVRVTPATGPVTVALIGAAIARIPPILPHSCRRGRCGAGHRAVGALRQVEQGERGVEDARPAARGLRAQRPPGGGGERRGHGVGRRLDGGDAEQQVPVGDGR